MRIANRVLSAALALSLVVGGLLVAAEVVVGVVGRGPWLVPYDRWERSARTTPWSDGDVRLLFAALVLAGAVLLVVEVARRRPEALTVRSGKGGVEAQLDRRGVERWLADKLERVDGVTEARARLGRKDVRVHVGTVERDTATTKQRVDEAIARHLGELELDQALPARVEVRSRRPAR